MRCYFGHGLPSSFPYFLKKKPGVSRRQIRTCSLVCFLPQKPNTKADEWRRPRRILWVTSPDYQLPSCSHPEVDILLPDPFIPYSVVPFFPTTWCLRLSNPFWVNIIPLSYPFTPIRMPLEYFCWNGLYSKQPAERAFAMWRIHAHYDRFRLAQRGAWMASIRYVILNATLSLTKYILSCRPTGWHGESGAAHSGGHITVDFLSSSNQHVVTHHVYPSDDAYPDSR
jgi:hypothetical protein